MSFGLVLIVAILRGTFRVPGDPSSKGNAIIAVPGIVRFGLKIAIFGASVYLLYDSTQVLAATIFGILILLLYIIAYERILWLPKQ